MHIAGATGTRRRGGRLDRTNQAAPGRAGPGAPSDPVAAADATARLVAESRANALGNLLRRSAARHGAKTALIDDDQTFSFAEFDQVVDSVAASLQRSAIAAGARVALLSRNCWEFAALAWGCARLGAVLVPVNFMLTAPDVAFQLADAEVTAFFAGADLTATAVDALARCGLPVKVRVAIRADAPPAGWTSFDRWLDAAPADDQPVPAGTVGEVVHRTPQATAGYRGLPAQPGEDRGGVPRRLVPHRTTSGSRRSPTRWSSGPATTPTPPTCSRTAGSSWPFNCPKRIEIVDALPKNPSGKILKRDLRTRFGTS